MRTVTWHTLFYKWRTKYFCGAIICLWYRWGLPDFSFSAVSISGNHRNDSTGWLDRVHHAEISSCESEIPLTVYMAPSGKAWLALFCPQPIFRCQNLASAWKDHEKGEFSCNEMRYWAMDKGLQHYCTQVIIVSWLYGKHITLQKNPRGLPLFFLFLSCESRQTEKLVQSWASNFSVNFYSNRNKLQFLMVELYCWFCCMLTFMPGSSALFWAPSSSELSVTTNSNRFWTQRCLRYYLKWQKSAVQHF